MSYYEIELNTTIIFPKYNNNFESNEYIWTNYSIKHNIHTNGIAYKVICETKQSLYMYVLRPEAFFFKHRMF